MKKGIVIGELIIILSAILAELIIAEVDIAFAVSSLFVLLIICCYSLLLSGEPEKAFFTLALPSLFILIKALIVLL